MGGAIVTGSLFGAGLSGPIGAVIGSAGPGGSWRRAIRYGRNGFLGGTALFTLISLSDQWSSTPHR